MKEEESNAQVHKENSSSFEHRKVRDMERDTESLVISLAVCPSMAR